MPRAPDLAGLSPDRRIMEPDGGDTEANQCVDRSDDVSSVTFCFRRGAGLVGGAYWIERDGELRRGRYELSALGLPRPGRRRSRVLVIKRVVASGVPDWFEVVNASRRPVQLDDFVYTDRPGETARVIAFPTKVLAPGAVHTQAVAVESSGFALSSEHGESLAIYRAGDLALSDRTEWPAAGAE